MGYGIINSIVFIYIHRFYFYFSWQRIKVVVLYDITLFTEMRRELKFQRINSYSSRTREHDICFKLLASANTAR